MWWLDIHFRYEDKRWVAKDGKPKSPSRGREEIASTHWQRPVESSGHGYIGNSEKKIEERKNIQTASRRDSVPAGRISLPVPPKGPEHVCHICLFTFCFHVTVPDGFLIMYYLQFWFSNSGNYWYKCRT